MKSTRRPALMDPGHEGIEPGVTGGVVGDRRTPQAQAGRLEVRPEVQGALDGHVRLARAVGLVEGEQLLGARRRELGRQDAAVGRAGAPVAPDHRHEAEVPRALRVRRPVVVPREAQRPMSEQACGSETRAAPRNGATLGAAGGAAADPCGRSRLGRDASGQCRHQDDEDREAAEQPVSPRSIHRATTVHTRSSAIRVRFLNRRPPEYRRPPECL